MSQPCPGGCGTGQPAEGYELCPACTDGANLLNRNAIRLAREETAEIRASLGEKLGKLTEELYQANEKLARMTAVHKAELDAAWETARNTDKARMKAEGELARLRAGTETGS